MAWFRLLCYPKLPIFEPCQNPQQIAGDTFLGIVSSESSSQKLRNVLLNSYFVVLEPAVVAAVVLVVIVVVALVVIVIGVNGGNSKTDKSTLRRIAFA